MLMPGVKGREKGTLFPELSHPGCLSYQQGGLKHKTRLPPQNDGNWGSCSAHWLGRQSSASVVQSEPGMAQKLLSTCHIYIYILKEHLRVGLAALVSPHSEVSANSEHTHSSRHHLINSQVC